MSFRGQRLEIAILIPMKNRCLPTYLIVRNLCLVLALVASSLWLTAEIHASANQKQQHTAALRKFLAYQVLLGMEQQP